MLGEQSQSQINNKQKYTMWSNLDYLDNDSIEIESEQNLYLERIVTKRGDAESSIYFEGIG